ncbi:MAG: MFS transporter [Pseudomonadales bacterium]|nr:MFS transporter [Pseudomonadales bacterium]
MPRSRSHHLHLPNYTFDDSKNMKLLYAIRIVRDLVNKMAMIFLPIFLFSIGSETNFLKYLPYSDFQRGMLAIAIYYVVVGLIGFLVGVPSGKALGKIGYQRSFVISFMLRTLMFIFLFAAKQNPFYLWFAMTIDAVNSTMFWGGYFSILSKTANQKNIGKDLGLLQFLLQIVAVVSPAISGAIAYFVGLEYLFLIGMILTLLSSVLALMMDVELHENSISFDEFLSWIKEKRFLQLAIAYSGKHINDTVIYLWPLYVFFLLGSVDRVGYLYTLSLFLAMFMTFFIGKFIDRYRNKKPLYFSGGLLSLLWIVRTQVFSIWNIALVDTFDRLATNVYSLVFDTIFLGRGKGHSSDKYFVYLEMVLSINRVIFWSGFGLFFIFFSSWNSIFIFAGVAVLVSLLVSDKKTGYV